MTLLIHVTCISSLAWYVNKMYNACIGGSRHPSRNDVIILSNVNPKHWSRFFIIIIIYSRLLLGFRLGYIILLSLSCEGECDTRNV